MESEHIQKRTHIQTQKGYRMKKQKKVSIFCPIRPVARVVYNNYREFDDMEGGHDVLSVSDSKTKVTSPAQGWNRADLETILCIHFVVSSLLDD